MALFGTASIWAKIAFLLIFCALIMQIVCISTQYWMQIETNSESIEMSIGLWKAQNCSVGPNNDCDAFDIPEKYLTNVFKCTMAFALVILVFIFITLVVSGTYIATDRFREMPIAIFIAAACFVTVLLGLIVMIMWLSQLPDLWYPGYSFGLGILATVLMLFAGLLMIPDIRQYNARRRPNVMKVRPDHRRSGFGPVREQTPSNKKFASMQNETKVRHYHNPNRDSYVRSPPPEYRTSLNDKYPSKQQPPSYGRDARSDVQEADVYLGRLSTKMRRF